jgi:prepilin-type N-terminal cleavage/methylation domain-containing protein
MINSLLRPKHRRTAGETNGFTMIEILIVMVVLGILAAVVIFALGGITTKTAQASCAADGATVSTAMADFNNQNPNPPAGSMMTGLLNGTSLNGNSPYIQSWPNNTPHYAFELSTAVGTPVNATAANQLEISITPAGAVVAATQLNYHPYTGPTSCVGVS